MRQSGSARLFGIAGVTVVINLLVLGTLSLLNWQKAVSMPTSLREVSVVRLQSKKPKEVKLEIPARKIQAEPKRLVRKQSKLKKSYMDKFLRNVKLGHGLGTVASPKLFLPQEEELALIVRVETGATFRLRENLVDLPPRPVFSKRPEYPRLARLRELEGFVEVEFVVTVAGTVKDIFITKSAPEGVFDKAVLRALRIWKFEPARHKGKVVECRCAKRFRFVLTEDVR